MRVEHIDERECRERYTAREPRAAKGNSRPILLKNSFSAGAENL
jgi:hypothetical protein